MFDGQDRIIEQGIYYDPHLVRLEFLDEKGDLHSIGDLFVRKSTGEVWVYCAGLPFGQNDRRAEAPTEAELIKGYGLHPRGHLVPRDGDLSWCAVCGQEQITAKDA